MWLISRKLCLAIIDHWQRHKPRVARAPPGRYPVSLLSRAVIDDVSVDLQVLGAQVDLDGGVLTVRTDEACRVAADLERLEVEAVLAADEGDVAIGRAGASRRFEIGKLAVAERIGAAVH